MKIIKKISQSRRDFVADISCEFCGNKEKLTSGYDDSFYYTDVLPKMVCKSCNKSTVSGGGVIDVIEPKYPEGFVI